MNTTINLSGTICVEVPDDFYGEEELSLVKDLDRLLRTAIEMAAVGNECDAKEIQLDFNIDNYE